MTSIRHTITAGDRAMEAARQAIIDLGWGRTTLTEVARRAGVSRMTVYRRWGDMAGLLGDVLTREWEEILSALPARDNTTPEGLASTVADATIIAREDPLLSRVTQSDPQALMPYLTERPGRSGRMMLDLLTAWIGEGQQAGSIRQGDPGSIAGAVLLAAYGFNLSLQIVGTVDVMKAELEKLVRSYLTP